MPRPLTAGERPTLISESWPKAPHAAAFHSRKAAIKTKTRAGRLRRPAFFARALGRAPGRWLRGPAAAVLLHYKDSAFARRLENRRHRRKRRGGGSGSALSPTKQKLRRPPRRSDLLQRGDGAPGIARMSAPHRALPLVPGKGAAGSRLLCASVSEGALSLPPGKRGGPSRRRRQKNKGGPIPKVSARSAEALSGRRARRSAAPACLRLSVRPFIARPSPRRYSA